jgi:Ribonuclease G/E
VSRRRLYLDRAPGETRAVVTLDGLPERLLIERLDDVPGQRLGARVIARVRAIERGLSGAFLDLGGGPDAVLALTGAARGVAEGASVEIEITAEARRDKGALVRLIGPAQGPPRLVAAAPGLTERLTAFAPGIAVIEGDRAREAADIAEAAAMAVEHTLPGGGLIAIEPTRALTAVDVDLQASIGDRGRAVRRINLAAIDHAARLLRLKGLSGLIAIDLIGAGLDGAALAAAAKAAFAADEPGVSIGPVSRFGLLQLVTPRRGRPVGEVLSGPDGAPTAATVALRLLRALEREGRADGGARLEGRAAPAVLAAAAPYIEALSARLGGRFILIPDAGAPPHGFEVSVR